MTKHGVEMHLDPQDYVDSKILHNGYYEEEVLTALQQRLLPGECFWDVGANLGLHALTISKLCDDVTVVAFEPNPRLAEVIGMSARSNSLNIKIIPIALHDQESTEKFYLYEGNQGRSGLHNWNSDPLLKHIEVRAARADYLVNASDQGLKYPNVIKIDVEGHELQALHGMSDLLEQSHVHTIVFEDSKGETSLVREFLIGHGFTIRRLSRMEDTSHDLENYQAVR